MLGIGHLVAPASTLSGGVENVNTPRTLKKKLSLMSLVTGSCGEPVLVDGTGCKHEVVAIGERVSSEERDGSIMVAAMVLLLFEMTR